MKDNIIVLYGGKSVEHDVSIITGLQVLENIDYKKHNVIPVYISRNGEWQILKDYKNIESYKSKDIKKQKVTLISGSPYLAYNGILGYRKKVKISCAVLCTHGTNCEDGALQGLLQSSMIAYTGCGILSSAIGMDKVVMKDLFVANKIPCVKYIELNKFDYYKCCIDNTLNSINLKYPLIVKPSNLGSSVGINKCTCKGELKLALDIAFQYDTRVIVEELVQNMREINCSVMGDGNYCTYSNLEEPMGWKDFLTFDDKYILGKKKQSEKNLKLDKKTKTEIKKLALKVFKTFKCSGVVRIDFMIDNNTKQVYVNEINTIPGSLSFYLWKHDFKTHIEELIQIAKNEFKNKNELLYDYNSKCLDNYESGQKLKK